MNRGLISVIEQIGREKGIDKEILFEAVESALQSACRKSHSSIDNIRIEIDRKTGEFCAYLRKRVVDEVADPEAEIDRKSVVWGKSVDLGGRRIIKKKKIDIRMLTDMRVCDTGVVVVV